MRANLRDNQRSKLYAAESVLKGVGQRWESVQEVQEYVDRVTDRAYVRRHYPLGMSLTMSRGLVNNRIEVLDGRGRRSGAAYGYTITLPRFARTEYYVLHEVAHILTRNRYGRVAAHGWQFAATELDLVRHMMGHEAEDMLRQSFRAHRVKFRKPRKGTGRVMSVEEKEALVARLAAGRARAAGES